MRSPAVRLGRAVAAVTTLSLFLAGCDFDGTGSLALPLREGTGSGSYAITVEMAEVANLVPNAEVKFNDITVGAVTRTEVQDWHAVLTVGLNQGTTLPANTTARIAQKSLLGAEYLELAPPSDEPAVGRLADGDRIPLDRTGNYPETEEVLAALSVVLNGSGLQQVKTITSELDDVLGGGRQKDARALIGNLQTFVASLDAQRGDIVHAIDGLNRFSATIAKDNRALAEGLDAIPPALEVLNQDRDNLVHTLERLGIFGDTAVHTINEVRDDLLANLSQLRPAVRKLADSSTDLTESLSQIVTFPFPANTTFPSMLKGDYGNLFATFELSPGVLFNNFLAGGFELPMAGGPGLLKVPPLGAGQKIVPPLAPFLDGQAGVPGATAPPIKPDGPLGDLFGGGK